MRLLLACVQVLRFLRIAIKQRSLIVCVGFLLLGLAIAFMTGKVDVELLALKEAGLQRRT